MRKIILAILLCFCMFTTISMTACGNNDHSGSEITRPTEPNDEITDNRPESPEDKEDNILPEIIFDKDKQLLIVENIKTWLMVGGVEELEGEVYTFVSEKTKFTLSIDLTNFDYLDEDTITDLINSALEETITEDNYSSNISCELPVVVVSVEKVK